MRSGSVLRARTLRRLCPPHQLRQLGDVGGDAARLARVGLLAERVSQASESEQALQQTDVRRIAVAVEPSLVPVSARYVVDDCPDRDGDNDVAN